MILDAIITWRIDLFFISSFCSIHRERERKREIEREREKRVKTMHSSNSIKFIKKINTAAYLGQHLTVNVRSSVGEMVFLLVI